MRPGAPQCVPRGMKILSALLLFLVSAIAQGASFDNASAASGSPVLAPDSIVLATGTGLAPAQEAKVDQPVASLGGISVQVVDSMSVVRLALVYLVSDTQIKYVLPAGT